jgi:pimeloyl-ACP methyl ester carboxylesterase
VEAWTLPDAPARLRMRVAQMQRRAFELQAQDGETPEGPDPLESDPGALARLELPVLVAYGEHDMSDFATAGGRLAAAIDGARLEVIAGAGHLAPMERPKPLSELLLGFLAGARPT